MSPPGRVLTVPCRLTCWPSQDSNSTPCGCGHIAANHAPAIEEDVGGRPAVGGIAVELSTQGGSGGFLRKNSPSTSLFGGVRSECGDGPISPRTTMRDSCCRFTAIPLLKEAI